MSSQRDRDEPRVLRNDAELQTMGEEIAAIADAAAAAAAAASPAAVLIDDEYPVLPPGPELTPETLVDAIVQAARSIQTYADTDPANVIRVTGLELHPDAKGRRIGAQGTLGKAHYEVAVWSPHSTYPGHRFEVRVQPSETCGLPFEALSTHLVAMGFRTSDAGRAFKPRFFFSRAVDDGLKLHVIVSADRYDAPRCITWVTLEMEPRND